MKALVYGSPEYEAVKSEILKVCRVVPTEKLDLATTVRKRIDYLKNLLKNTGRKAFILGISGGVDSTTTGRLCQLACEELRAEGYNAQFVAVRLPAGVQKDEADAQAALTFINPDKIHTINIGEAANNLTIQSVDQFKELGQEITLDQIDFYKGNLKARLRMSSQYFLSAMYEGLVAGTENRPEYSMAFFTRWGDQSSDFSVINDLNKRQVRLVAKELGAPEKLWNKAATADLEERAPGKLDEDALGFEYDYLDDFLEGKTIPTDVEIKIINHFDRTRFKRDPISEFKG